MNDVMTDKDWEKFFELLEKIVDIEAPVAEKITLVKDQAEIYGGSGEMALEEFLAWDFQF